MPVNLSIKNAPDAMVERLKARARRNHRSLQGEMMAILERATDEPATAAAPSADDIEDMMARRRAALDELAAFRARLPIPAKDAATLLSEMRDEDDARFDR